MLYIFENFYGCFLRSNFVIIGHVYCGILFQGLVSKNLELVKRFTRSICGSLSIVQYIILFTIVLNVKIVRV